MFIDGPIHQSSSISVGETPPPLLFAYFSCGSAFACVLVCALSHLIKQSHDRLYSFSEQSWVDVLHIPHNPYTYIL